MVALDRRLYTSHHAPTDTVTRVGPDRVKLARNGCMLPSAVRLSLSRYCTHQPLPCTVLTAAHHLHTRPPDAVPARLAYQRPLVNTYCMFDLRRHQRARHRLGPRRAFTVTRSGACIDLPGSGHARSLTTRMTLRLLTTRMTLRLLVVSSAVARAALPTVMTTVIAPGENPTFHLMRPQLNAAVSSRLDATSMSTTLSRPSRNSTA